MAFNYCKIRSKGVFIIILSMIPSLPFLLDIFIVSIYDVTHVFTVI